MEIFECKICSKKFKTEESMKQHGLAKHTESGIEQTKFNLRKYIIIFLIGAIIVFSVLAVRAYTIKPGAYDDFAKCLTERGVVIYGNDFCQYTTKQLSFFGKSGKYLKYVKCIDNKQLCEKKGVKITPTWEINDSMYEQVQTFENLARLSGCNL